MSSPRTPPRAGTTTSTARIQRINPNSTMPHARYSPNLHPGCDYANRDGECAGRPVTSGDGGRAGKSAQKKGSSPRSNAGQAGINLRSFSNQLVAEIDSALTDAQADELARRHGLGRIESQNLPLIGATIGLFRITDNRPADVARREFGAAAGEADAFAAVTAVTSAPAVPVAAVPGKPAAAPDRNDDSVSRALAGPAAAMASEKSLTGGANQPAAQ